MSSRTEEPKSEAPAEIEELCKALLSGEPLVPGLEGFRVVRPGVIDTVVELLRRLRLVEVRAGVSAGELARFGEAARCDRVWNAHWESRSVATVEAMRSCETWEVGGGGESLLTRDEAIERCCRHPPRSVEFVSRVVVLTPAVHDPSLLYPPWRAAGEPVNHDEAPREIPEEQARAEERSLFELMKIHEVFKGEK